jgi:glycosyltransferase involved in cell wall biosynthesis/SAM-dependent methyltransferase
VGNIITHLQQHGSEYEVALLSRAPVAYHYLSAIRRYAPQAKIILNTMDLHYLREAREAELDGGAEKITKAKHMKERELDIIRQCDATIVLSAVEKELLQKDLPGVKIAAIPLIFFDMIPDPPPFEEREDFLFIGSFPHPPNVDAVVFFCDEILPKVQRKLPGVKFHIVGYAPTPEVVALADRKGVVLHGFVKDVDPLFRKCKLSVAPLRYGAGIKGKIARSLSYGLPVIATSLAVEGMEFVDGEHVLIADDPTQFARALVKAYTDKDVWTRMSQIGRSQVLKTYTLASLLHPAASLMREVNPDDKQIDLHTLRSVSEYQLLQETISEEIAQRRLLEQSLVPADGSLFEVPGFCALCGRDSTFRVDVRLSPAREEDGKPAVDWRNQLTCTHCGLPSRVRAAMHIFFQQLKPDPGSAVYIDGATSALPRWMKNHLPGMIDGQLTDRPTAGKVIKGAPRKDDPTSLPFADNMFDHVISLDGKNLVKDDFSAFREVHRCLKPGGKFLFSVPFAAEKGDDEHTMEAVNGRVEEILPREIKMSASRPLKFSWDLLQDLKEAGFKEPRAYHYWSRDLAYLGGEQFVFVSTKPRVKEA